MTSRNFWVSASEVWRYWRDSRTPAEIYADPATPEPHLLRAGIRCGADLGVVLARPGKSAALVLAAVCYVTTVTLHLGDAARAYAGVVDDPRATLLDLIDEPELGTDALLEMTKALRSGCHAPAYFSLLCAVVSHPRAGVRVWMAALWSAPSWAVARAASATGRLEVAAVDFYQRERYSGPHLDDARLVQVASLVGRWSTWAAADPARAAFLCASSCDFTDEAALFAVGEALTSAPAR